MSISSPATMTLKSIQETTINKKAFMSGFLGASASVMGKLGISSTMEQSTATDWMLSVCIAAFTNQKESCTTVSSLAIRVLCVILMIVINACMMGQFLDGLQESGSVAATAISTAANFLFSALYGLLLFDERVNITWCFGFILILAGVWMLSTVKVKKE